MYRINELLKSDQKIFHTQDLALLFNISNPNTLYKSIGRFVKKGTLWPIYKGMYAITDPTNLDPWLLGIKALHQYAYVSCETILFQAGVINQTPQAITLVSSTSRQFHIGQQYYRCRQLKDEFLFNQTGISMIRSVQVASVERAAADVLYFNPHVHFDAPMNWKKIYTLQKDIGYPITKRK